MDSVSPPIKQDFNKEHVCAPVSDRAYLEQRGAIIVEESVGTIELRGEQFTLPVLVFVPDHIFESIDPKPFPRNCECRIGDRVYPFFTQKAGTAKIADRPIEVASEMIPETSVEKVLGPIFLKLLEEVATNALGGMNIILHPRIPSCMHSPITDKADTIHIFLECTPVTIKGYINPTTAFGIHVSIDGGYEPCLLPSPRRGITFSDGTHDVVQIIGNNVYVFFNPFKLHSLGIETASVIFQKTVALAIGGWLKRGELTKNEDDIPMTDESLKALAVGFVTKQKGLVTELVKIKQEKIRRIEGLLREEKRDLAHLVRFYRAIEQSDFDRHGIDRLIADHERMLAHPLVERVIIIPLEGVEIRTKMICIEHEGKNYRIGKFFIRFGFEDLLLIWAEEPCHHTGEPHPHLSAPNGPCFGNIGGAVDDALVECRYADALDYIMMWLGSYTPELVLWHKIEEWPLEEVRERVCMANEMEIAE